MTGKRRKCLIYKGWKAFEVYRENLVKYRKTVIRSGKKNDLQKVINIYYIRGDHSFETFLETKLWYYYHGSNE